MHFLAKFIHKGSSGKNVSETFVINDVLESRKMSIETLTEGKEMAFLKETCFDEQI